MYVYKATPFLHACLCVLVPLSTCCRGTYACPPAGILLPGCFTPQDQSLPQVRNRSCDARTGNFVDTPGSRLATKGSAMGAIPLWMATFEWNGVRLALTLNAEAGT